MKTKFVKLSIVLLLCVIFISLAIINNSSDKFNLEQNESVLKYDFNNCLGLYETENANVFFCAKNCIKLLNNNGQEKWSIDSDFSSPVICHNKNFLGISDIKTNSIHVYNSEGEKYNIKTEGNLLAFSVNASGYCVTISKNNTAYKIDVYNTNAEKFFTYVHSEANIFPVNANISPDGKILAISYVDTNNIEIDSKITFMYTNRDDIFASVNEKNNFISSLNFLSNNDIIIIGENEILFEHFNKDNIQERWRKKFDTNINMIAFNNNFIAVQLINKLVAQNKSLIKFFDMNGKNISDFEASQQFNSIKVCDKLNCVLLASQNEFMAVNLNGKVLWKYDVVGEQKFVAFLKANKILFASSTKAYIVNIKNKGE